MILFIQTAEKGAASSELRVPDVSNIPTRTSIARFPAPFQRTLLLICFKIIWFFSAFEMNRIFIISLI